MQSSQQPTPPLSSFYSKPAKPNKSAMRLRSGKVIEHVPAYIEPQQQQSQLQPQSLFSYSTDESDSEESAPFLQSIESDCTKFDPSAKRPHHSRRLVNAKNADLACYSPRKMKCGHLCCLEFVPNCCKCSDRRPPSQRAQKYVDGHGMVTLKRISADYYCPVCQKLTTRKGSRLK